jgi:hypothetical protein
MPETLAFQVHFGKMKQFQFGEVNQEKLLNARKYIEKRPLSQWTQDAEEG